MSNAEKFREHINQGYAYKKDFIVMGGAMYEGECQPDTLVKIPLKTLNRHGLIAGATGTGKTKTLQVFAEQLSIKGIPVMMMDLKGDLSGLAQPGEMNDHIKWRHGVIGVPYKAEPMPVELLSLSDEKGVRLRATVTEFGPVLFSKMLNLNDTQGGVMTLLFKYCDDHKMPLLDLRDMKKVLQWAENEGRDELEKEYGRVAPATVSTILRSVVELEQQGADIFFGEKSFDVNDLLRTKDGKGVVSIVRLTDIQDRPKLFSTFMLCLLAEIYNEFPEQGDQDEPKLILFIDEAHLIFKEASSALLDQLESIIKLIRSKGVGIYFCTQNPMDIPDDILAQLGLKMQHALRAFTAKDRKAISKTAENYPISDFYKTDELLTSLGIGEALITCLNEKGIPTPLAATLLLAPKTRMDILSEKEIDDLVKASALIPKYEEVIDRNSAYEMLTGKMDKAEAAENQKEQGRTSTAKSGRQVKEKSMVEQMSKNTMVRQVGRTVMRELTRGLLGLLKK